MTEYDTQDDDPIPEQITDQLAHADDWDHLDPMSIAVIDGNFDELYRVIEKGTLDDVLIDDRGNVYDPESFQKVTKIQSAALPKPDDDLHYPFTYNSGPDLVSRDHFREHVTRVIVIEENVKYVLNSRGGVLWHDSYTDQASAEGQELAIGLAETGITHGEDQCEINIPDQFEKAAGGWHSSMEPSPQVDLINALTSGDVDPAWGDEIYPYAVRFGDTRNCCSQPGSIYAKSEFAAILEDELNNKRATPAYAGIN